MAALRIERGRFIVCTKLTARLMVLGCVLFLSLSFFFPFIWDSLNPGEWALEKTPSFSSPPSTRFAHALNKYTNFDLLRNSTCWSVCVCMSEMFLYMFIGYVDSQTTG